MKSYTDLEQSKKLAEILPIESADMYYTPPLIKGHTDYIPHLKRKLPIDWDIEQKTPCWSLAALLDALPTLDNKYAVFGTSIKGSKWHVIYHNIDTLFLEDSGLHSNLVDACYEMIIKLHELNLL